MRKHSVEIPIRLVSEANQREFWAVKAKRKKKQQTAALLFLRARPSHLDTIEKAEIVLTRFGGRRMDSDNLAGAFKHVQDAVAHWLGIDDGDERLTWTYKQEKGPGKMGAAYSVLVEVVT